MIVVYKNNMALSEPPVPFSFFLPTYLETHITFLEIQQIYISVINSKDICPNSPSSYMRLI